MSFKQVEFVLGGARSGKSSFAENLAKQSQLPVKYIATGQAGDGEMATRIEHHQQHRPPEWDLVEEPIDLAGVLAEHDAQGQCLLIDCLTLWVTNCLCAQVEDPEQFWLAEKKKFLQQLQQCKGTVILVSNEVGQGIVPLGKLSRQFVDHSGWLHQEVAQIADNVVFVVAGLPQILKGKV